jgi:hypothetical protein
MTHRKIPDEFFCIAFVWYFRFEKISILAIPAASGKYKSRSVWNI